MKKKDWLHFVRSVYYSCHGNDNVVYPQAIKLGLVTRDHVWVMPAFNEDWWKSIGSYNNCTLKQMRNALLNVLFMDSYPWDPNPAAKSVSGHV